LALILDQKKKKKKKRTNIYVDVTLNKKNAMETAISLLMQPIITTMKNWSNTVIRSPYANINSHFKLND